jgi:cell wall-associated NlpC family hydrolase
MHRLDTPAFFSSRLPSGRLRISAVMAAFAFVLPFSCPQATAMEPLTPPVAAAAAAESQSMEVSSDAARSVVYRDGYAVTSRAGLASMAIAAGIAPAPRIPDGGAVVAFAMQYVGVIPYTTGASPAEGFMCDGLTQYVFAQFGVFLPREVRNQLASGTAVPFADARAGDLVVWVGEHVGIYDGAGGVVHSPSEGLYVSHQALWGSPVFVRLY